MGQAVAQGHFVGNGVGQGSLGVGKGQPGLQCSQRHACPQLAVAQVLLQAWQAVENVVDGRQCEGIGERIGVVVPD
ncbi:hypothetical protein D3C79_951900 [compost metagenome]